MLPELLMPLELLPMPEPLMPVDPPMEPLPLVLAAIASELDKAAVTANSNSLCLMIVPLRG